MAWEGSGDIAWNDSIVATAIDFDGGNAGFDITTFNDDGGSCQAAAEFDIGNGSRGGGGDRTCFNCGEAGHSKSGCPNPQVVEERHYRHREGHVARECPRRLPMRCGNCKQEGHFIADCPEKLVCPRCTGEHLLRDCPEPLKCYHCGGDHMAKECPTYVAVCENCSEPGHTANECQNARKVDRSHLPDMTGEQAWLLLEKAIVNKDMDYVKECIQIYVKAQPTTTYVQLEEALRSQGYGLYLIPKQRTNLSVTLTNMDLQGCLGKKYTVNYRFSHKPLRQSEREGWPEDHAVVMERLADAGEVVPWVGRPKCGNCNKLGHVRNDCPEDKLEGDRVVVRCYNCEQEGHRIRDCTIPRVEKFACKNCGMGGHKAAECPEPRSAAKVECRRCNEMGHFSKDCPKEPTQTCRNCGDEGHMAKACDKPRNMANIQCRNCDEYGHQSRECPKPRDWSRVECQNCHEKGHTKVRCTKPPLDEVSGGLDKAAGFDSIESGGAAGGGESAVWQTRADACW